MADNFISVKLDTRRFNNAINEIAYNIQRPVKEVVRAEVGSILKQCVGETKVATNDMLKIKGQLKAGQIVEVTGGQDVTINVGRRNKGTYGRVFYRTDVGNFRRTHDEGFQPVAGMPSKKRNKPGDLYKNYKWLTIRDAILKFKAEVKKQVPLARGSLGLARQSWVQIAKGLGIDLKAVPGGRASAAAITKAEAAIASDGRRYINGQGQAFSTNKSYIARLTNSLPYNRAVGLDPIIRRVIRGRTQFFKQNMARGVFQDIKKTLRAYPGFSVFMSN